MDRKSQRAAEFFALKRNTSVLLLALVLAGTGERLWVGFAPKYLLVLGAAPFVIGVFDALQTFLGAVYAYPGGWLTDRWDDEIAHFVQCDFNRRLCHGPGMASLAGIARRHVLFPGVERAFLAGHFQHCGYFFEVDAAHDGNRGAIHGATSADDDRPARGRVADYAVWLGTRGGGTRCSVVFLSA